MTTKTRVDAKTGKLHSSVRAEKRVGGIVADVISDVARGSGREPDELAALLSNVRVGSGGDLVLADVISDVAIGFERNGEDEAALATLLCGLSVAETMRRAAIESFGTRPWVDWASNAVSDEARGRARRRLVGQVEALLGGGQPADSAEHVPRGRWVATLAERRLTRLIRDMNLVLAVESESAGPSSMTIRFQAGAISDQQIARRLANESHPELGCSLAEYSVMFATWVRRFRFEGSSLFPVVALYSWVDVAVLGARESNLFPPSIQWQLERYRATCRRRALEVRGVYDRASVEALGQLEEIFAKAKVNIRWGWTAGKAEVEFEHAVKRLEKELDRKQRKSV